MAQAKLRADAERVLRTNDRGGFTVPSARLYPHQWAWDSAFSALGWFYLDPDRALKELEILVQGQWKDGRIPHIRFHDLNGKYFPGPDFWGTHDTSTISQPPVWATVLRRMYEKGADKKRVQALLKPFRHSHHWFHTQRDPLDWGLVAVTHPWESGMDNSPAWDLPLQAVDPAQAPPFKRVDKDIVGDAAQRPTDGEYQRYAALVKEISDNHFGPSSFQVYDPFMTAVLAQAETDLGWLCQQFGESDDGLAWAQRYQDALGKRLWDPDKGRFLYYDVPTRKFLDCEVLGAYMPAMLDIPSAPDCLKTLQARYQAAWTLPTVAPGTPGFDPIRYWRGPVWANTNWLLRKCVPGLAERTLELVSLSGFREYFNPQTGAGLGATDFSWTAALVLDLLG